MGTLRQKRLAKGIIDNLSGHNRVKTAAELLDNAGYSETVQTASPKRTFAQKGVVEELNRMGFDEETAKRVVGQILENSDEEARDRLKAAEIVFKVHGSFAPEKHVNVNVVIEPNPRIKRLAERLNK